MELDDYLKGFDELSPERGVIILNLNIILGSFIQAKQRIAAGTIRAAIGEIESSWAANQSEVARDFREDASRITGNEDEIPF